uniref:Uncharacterized protein n=1 Tax=Anopheles melas TaxID=34690 RepID=A0A182U5H8_9DIPT
MRPGRECELCKEASEEEERERERTAAAAAHHCRRDHPHHCQHHHHHQHLHRHPHTTPPAGFPSSGSLSLASSPSTPSSPTSLPLTVAAGGEPAKQHRTTTAGLLRSARDSFIGRRQPQQRSSGLPGAATGAVAACSSSSTSTVATAAPPPTVTSPLLAKAKERCKLFSMQRQQYQHCHSQSIEMDVYDTEGQGGR